MSPRDLWGRLAEAIGLAPDELGAASVLGLVALAGTAVLYQELEAYDLVRDERASIEAEIAAVDEVRDALRAEQLEVQGATQAHLVEALRCRAPVVPAEE